MTTTSVDNTSLFRGLIKIFEKNDQEKNENATAAGATILPQSGCTSKTLSKSKQQTRLFSLHARQILSDITELRDLVLDKRKEYILCSNAFSMHGVQRFMSEENRKKFDRETDIAIKQCTKLIKDLEIQILSEHIQLSTNESRHLMTIVNLLNVYLKEVFSIVAQLRQIHVRKTRQYRKICRLANLVDIYGPRLEIAEREERLQEEKLSKVKLELEENKQRLKLTLEEDNFCGKNSTLPSLQRNNEVLKTKVTGDGWDDAFDIPELMDQPETIKKSDPDTVLNDEDNLGSGWIDADLDINIDDVIAEEQIKPTIVKRQNQQPKRTFIVGETDENVKMAAVYEPTNKAELTQLVKENQKLFERFTTSDAELQRIESHVAEIQRLQSVFAEKVSEQEQDIDIIHTRTVYILDNLEQANDFIREAIKNQANRRVIMIFCLLVLTFTLLFLDWYNP